MNHKEVINLWPSMTVLSQDIGEKYGTINMWRVRNRIPADQWVGLVESAQARDIPLTYKMLAEAAAKNVA